MATPHRIKRLEVPQRSGNPASTQRLTWQSRVSNWFQSHRALTMVLVVGFALRAARLLWGLPILRDVGFYHGDEAKSWNSLVAFPEEYLTSTNYIYGTAVQYSVGVLLLPVRLVMVEGLRADAAYVLTAIVTFRAVNVLLGTAAIWLTYVLGRRADDERTGLLAAALLSVAFAPT